MFIFFGGNPRFIIGDRDDRPAIDVFGLNHHFATSAAMLDRIIDEGADGIQDQVAITSPSPATVRRVPSCSAAASYNSTTSLTISTRFTDLNPPFRACVSICA